MSMENRGQPDGAGIDRVYQLERSPLSAREQRILTDIEIQFELRNARLAARFHWDAEHGRWNRPHGWWPFR